MGRWEYAFSFGYQDHTVETLKINNKQELLSDMNSGVSEKVLNYLSLLFYLFLSFILSFIHTALSCSGWQWTWSLSCEHWAWDGITSWMRHQVRIKPWALELWGSNATRCNTVLPLLHFLSQESHESILTFKYVCWNTVIWSNPSNSSCECSPLKVLSICFKDFISFKRW